MDSTANTNARGRLASKQTKPADAQAATALAFEKQVAKVLAKWMHGQIASDQEKSDREFTTPVSCTDRIYELAVKWQPRWLHLVGAVRSIALMMDVDKMALSDQSYFLQSLVNVNSIKPGAPSMARKILAEVIPFINSSHCWTRALAACTVRNVVKCLDFQSKEITAELSEICQRLKTSIEECAGKRWLEVHRICATMALVDTIIIWCERVPSKMMGEDFEPGLGLETLLQLIETKPISPMLKWTTADGIRRLVQVAAFWGSLMDDQMLVFLELVPKIMIAYRLGETDPLTTTLILKGMLKGQSFYSWLEAPVLVNSVLTNLLLVLQPRNIVDNDTQVLEMRYTCVRLLGRFVLEYTDVDEEESSVTTSNSSLNKIKPVPLKNASSDTQRSMAFVSGTIRAALMTSPASSMEAFSATFQPLTFGLSDDPLEIELHELLKDAYSNYVLELGERFPGIDMPRLIIPRIVL